MALRRREDHVWINKWQERRLHAQQCTLSEVQSASTPPCPPPGIPSPFLWGQGERGRGQQGRLLPIREVSFHTGGDG